MQKFNTNLNQIKVLLTISRPKHDSGYSLYFNKSWSVYPINKREAGIGKDGAWGRDRQRETEGERYTDTMSTAVQILMLYFLCLKHLNLKTGYVIAGVQ